MKYAPAVLTLPKHRRSMGHPTATPGRGRRIDRGDILFGSPTIPQDSPRMGRWRRQRDSIQQRTLIGAGRSLNQIRYRPNVTESDRARRSDYPPRFTVSLPHGQGDRRTGAGESVGIMGQTFHLLFLGIQKGTGSFCCQRRDVTQANNLCMTAKEPSVNVPTSLASYVPRFGWEQVELTTPSRPAGIDPLLDTYPGRTLTAGEGANMRLYERIHLTGPNTVLWIEVRKAQAPGPAKRGEGGGA